MLHPFRVEIFTLFAIVKMIISPMTYTPLLKQQGVYLSS